MELNINYSINKQANSVIIFHLPDNVNELTIPEIHTKYQNMFFCPIANYNTNFKNIKLHKNIKTITFAGYNKFIDNLETITWSENLKEITIEDKNQPIDKLIEFCESKSNSKVIAEPKYEWSFKESKWISYKTLYYFPPNSLNGVSDKTIVTLTQYIR